MNLTIQPNQSILDAVLMRYGSLDAAIAFCCSNGIPISSIPAPGTQYNAPLVQSSYEMEASGKYLHSNGIIIGTAGAGICGMVSGLSIIDLGSNHVRFIFVAGEGVEHLQWAIVEGDISEAPMSVNACPPGATHLSIFTLSSDTTYSFFIRTRCYGSASAWSRMVFSTMPGHTMTKIIWIPYLNVNLGVGDTAPLFPLEVTIAGPSYLHYSLVTPPTVPVLSVGTKTDWDSGVGFASLITATSYNFASASYLIALPTIETPEVYMWVSATPEGGPGSTYYYVNEHGHNITSAPVLLYSQVDGLIAMQGRMELGDVYTASGTLHIPLTILHGGDNPHFSVVRHVLRKQVDGIWVDISGPHYTGDEVVLHFPAGLYHIGLFTTYQSSDLSAPEGPLSINSFVIEIA